MRKIPAFAEELVFYCEKTTDLPDVKDDIKRESFFELQALQSCVKARNQITSAGFKFIKPPNFSGVQFKSDKQIQKAVEAIEQVKANEKALESVRKERLFKKLSKKLQTEKTQNKKRQKHSAKK